MNTLAKLTIVTLILLGFAHTSCADIVTFSTDFNSGLPSQVSGIGTLTGVQGYDGLGEPGNQFSGDFFRNEAGNGIINGVELTLTDLPSHTSVSVDFLLAIIDSWDGVGDNTNGPDGFAVAVDGNVIFSEVFENSYSGTQTYMPPPGVELARHEDLGFRPPASFFWDSAYDMGQDPTFNNIAHTSSTLTVNWFRNGGNVINSPSFVDESWAIDNLSVTLHGTAAVPEPASLAFLGVTGLCLFSRRRRRN